MTYAGDQNLSFMGPEFNIGPEMIDFRVKMTHFRVISPLSLNNPPIFDEVKLMGRSPWVRAIGTHGV